MELPLHMKPGTFIVFEGLDGTGKSTQLERLERSVYAPDLGQPLFDPPPMFTHQPSGATGLGPDIYQLTESVDWRVGDPLTRQLLHLAAHTEHYAHDILPALEESAVIMDRCWWSTYAYGYRGRIKASMTPHEWLRICQLPTQERLPDLVFYFGHRHIDVDVKAATDRRTLRNYDLLMDQYRENTVNVPPYDVGETTAFISGELYRRGFVLT